MPVSKGTNANINIRVNRDIKNKAQDVFSGIGLDMTTAINIFLRQAIRKNGIPFEVVSDYQQRAASFGCMKNKMSEADDHDWFEPMEEFKEYV